jgi:hypothetical protein
VAFKLFEAYGAASRPEATLRASGYLFLSRGILKRAGNEHAKYCQLMFDENNGFLGVKLVTQGVDVKTDSTREMTTERSGAAVNIMPVLRYYGFPKLKGKKVLEVTFEEGLIVISLNELKHELKKEVVDPAS